MTHRESLDAQLLNKFLLALIQIPQSDVDNVFGVQAGLEPVEAGKVLGIFHQAHQEGHGHAVHVARARGVRSVDIGVSINLKNR